MRHLCLNCAKNFTIKIETLFKKIGKKKMNTIRSVLKKIMINQYVSNAYFLSYFHKMPSNKHKLRTLNPIIPISEFLLWIDFSCHQDLNF